LAKAVCSYSPWQFIYWYDRPKSAATVNYHGTIIQELPELAFFQQLPTTWDDSRVLAGKMDKWAVIARRSGDDWYIGAMNGKEQTSFTVPLTFLRKDTKYIAEIYADSPSADEPQRVSINRIELDNSGELEIKMRPNGGQAFRLIPAPATPISKATGDDPKRVAAAGGE
jgi:alpha-glucosidase